MKKSLLPAFPEERLFFERPHSASIIINNYNYATFVGEAIKSALAQTHPAQIIVVDDGSTDESRAVIQKFGTRIETVFKSNGGQASALNTGFTRAKGGIIFFLDSDDLLEPNAVADILSVWRVGTVLAHYPMTIIDAHNTEHGITPGAPARLADGDVRNELLTTGSFASTTMSGMAFFRAALDRVMPMPERSFVYAADGYLLRAMAFLGPVQYVELRLARYRLHDRNDSDPLSGVMLNADAVHTASAGFRKKIRYSQNEFETTKKFAEINALPVVPNLGERHADFLGYRLFSLLLDPAHHPIAGDRRFNLLRRYVVRRWLSSWPLRRRAMAVSLAATAALVNSSSALRLISWMHGTNNRPQWFRNLAALLRRKANAGLHVNRVKEDQILSL